MNNQNIMTKEFNELRDFILSKGYTCWDTKHQEFHNVEMITQKLQRRVDNVYNISPVCNCNDKIFINIDINQTTINGGINMKTNSFKCGNCFVRNFNMFDEVIFKLFNNYWVGPERDDVEFAKKQLLKSLTDQVEGYWSGLRLIVS